MKITSTEKKISSLDFGAVVKDDGIYFHIWAPKLTELNLFIKTPAIQLLPMKREANGYFSCFVPELKAGALYQYQVGDQKYPDPCSRYLPQGPHGPSMVIDPISFEWQDDAWQQRGIELKGQVIYELHVGTFSPSGTYAGVKEQLPALKKLGVSLIELMPLAEFPGRWNWGYDGVCLYAPSHVYGTPDDLRQLVDSAHGLGMGIMLDVVYNHLGPDGNYLKVFSDDYFTPTHTTDWGEAINFYVGKNSKEVRKYFIQNACYWIQEFHIDALRLDATQNIYDHGPFHILAEISQETRQAALPKKIILIGENESQETRLISPFKDNGYGLDSIWNDDFHHEAMVALNGRREAYFTDYLGKPQEFISLYKYGFLYQGQYYQWQKQNRGTVYGLQFPSESLVVYLQNHDQVANSLKGERMHLSSDPASCRAMTTIFLLSPQTPMLFMGQEFASSSPFLFFADHNKDLAPKVYEGRKEFLKQFSSFATSLDQVDNPNFENTFYKCKLNFEERNTNSQIYQLHADLLKIRREDPVISSQDRKSIDGAVVSDSAWVIRYFNKIHGDRLLLVNLGGVTNFLPCPEPLLAIDPQFEWQLQWSSEDPQYGGSGTVETFTPSLGVVFQARCAQLFTLNQKRDIKK